MKSLIEICESSKKAKYEIMSLSQEKKNSLLNAIKKELLNNKDEIIKANDIDIKNGRENNLNEGLLDRLMLNSERIEGICSDIDTVISLKDPTAIIEDTNILPSGLKVGKRRVPLGVIGIIYEARPNVTIDAATLCIKAGNAVILRGGKEAINSNIMLVNVMKKALKTQGLSTDIINIIEDTSRETATQFMKMNEYIDVLIPRGGAGLIKAAVTNATIPVIETGTGNCHIYVEKSADFDMARRIAVNSKISRVSVCNSAESLVVDKAIAKEFLPLIKEDFEKANVKMVGCAETVKIIDIEKADDIDFKTEYLDYKISIMVVENIDSAIRVINENSTGHSESIVTSDYFASEKFLNEIDSAAVYVNASTRFTDGAQFGLGAEIGISTQKLHARGPMGLRELTTIKYIIYGNGQVR